MIDLMAVTATVGVVYVFCIAFVPTSALLLKGKAGIAALYFFLPIVGTAIGLISLVRLAKPNSWWARRRYGVYQMQAARERYSGASTQPDRVLPGVALCLIFVFGPAMIVVGLLAPPI